MRCSVKMSNEEKNQQVSQYWEWVAKRSEKGFWNVPGWEAHQNMLASGNPQRNWLDELGDFVKQKYGAEIPERALSLGCGNGCLEPFLLEKNLCQHCDACDISPGLVESAQEKADRAGLPLHYFVSDLNRPAFEKEKYDLVVAAGILHHIENLELLFDNVLQALKPGGCFLIYDYVGPSRFQWTPAQMQHCNRWIKKIPLKMRVKRGYPWYYVVAKVVFNAIPFKNSRLTEKLAKKALPARGYCQFLRLKNARLILNEIIPPPPEQFYVTDPSEAIRSEEILPLIEQRFRIEKFIPQGGTLAAPLFSRIVDNFISSPYGIKIAKEILADEREKVSSGILKSDFVALVATKP